MHHQAADCALDQEPRKWGRGSADVNAPV